MFYGLAIVLIPLFLGYFFKISRPTVMQFVNRIVSISLYLILLVMGISLGQLDDILNKLPQIGAMALGLCVIIQICNLIGLGIYDRLQPMQHEAVEVEELPSRFHQLLDSLKLIGTTLLGGILGYMTKGLVDFPFHASNYVLEVMIFGIGIQLRNSGIPLKEVFLNKCGIYTAIIVAVTSLIGGVIAAFALNLSVLQGLTFASAFGWYSLSSVLVNDAWGPMYGSVAFFNDLLREITCLFMIPFLMKCYPTSAVGLGGATSLDVMLPVIQKTGGIQIVPLAISASFILNLLPPLLLAFFIGLAA